jgi:hypothetical protein
MKKICFLITLLLFISCKKGANYCEIPMDFDGFKALPASNDPANPVTVEMEFSWEADLDWYEKSALVTFTVPSVFVNPKGDRPVDTIEGRSYTYTLKDPSNAPDSVVVSAYVFNDCGKSVEHFAVIRYN